MKHLINTPDEILGRLLQTSAKLFKRQLAENLYAAGFEIKVEEAITMGIVYTDEGISQQAITNLINCEKTAMTRIVDKLEEMKLVERMPDTEDRRQNKIYLTTSGKQLVGRLFKIAKKTEAQAFDGLSATQIKIMKEALILVRSNLSESVGHN